MYVNIAEGKISDLESIVEEIIQNKTQRKEYINNEKEKEIWNMN